MERRSGGESLTPTDVFIHGWVYDIENGEIRDLNVSVGPPGKPIPAAPFEAVVNAAAGTPNTSGSGGETTESPVVNSSSSTDTKSGGEVEARCQQLCKAKRFFFGRNAV